MELMFLVYAVENLTYGGAFFMALFWATLVLLCVAVLGAVMYSIESDENKVLALYNKLPKKTLIVVLMIFLVLHSVLPTRQTAIYMASAYAIQQVVTADKTQELANKGYNALSSQLDKWATEVPEVADMLIDAGLSKAKEKVVEEVSK